MRNGGLVKTLRFNEPKYVGDPINAVRIFNEKEVDELMVLDIDASKEDREPNYALIEQFASECFMPLTYGGGVRKIDRAQRLFSLGVEKVCLQTAALKRPEFITELVSQFGSQSIMISMDVKNNWLGKPKPYQSSTGKTLDANWLELLQKLVDAGAGEALLNAVDRDGTVSGPDLQLIRDATSSIDVPLIALGGISSLTDIKACVAAGASAVAVGSLFVFHGPHRAVLITYPKYRELEQLFEGNT
jgi:cyclase